MTAKPSGDSSKQQATEPSLSRQLEGQELADIVARDVKAKNDYRASKTPAPLMVMSTPGATAPTRLDRWQAVASWTIWEAAMLLHGFDPGPIGGAARTQESLLGRPTQAGTIEPKPKAVGLCGQWFIGERHFWPVLEVVDAWRREPDATEKVPPARFIKWCQQRGLDTGWLRTIKEEQPALLPTTRVPETKEQRQKRRYQMCIDAGLNLPNNDYASLPRGVKKVAEREGVARQTFTDDVKAHIRRLNGR